MHGSDTTFVFLLGTGRCGSSLVQEVVSRHRDVAFISNLDDRLRLPPATTRLNNAIYRRVPSSLTTKGRLRYAPSEGYRALEREVSPLVSRPGRPLDKADATPWLVARLRHFFGSRARAQNRPVFLHKFTGWPRVGLLDEAFPGARFVNVVRDGRAVASSLVQMPWWRDAHELDVLRRLPDDDVRAWEASGERFPLLAGLVWKAVVTAHEVSRASVRSGRWMDVRYEDIVDDPVAAFDAVLTFAGLSRDGDFDRQRGRHSVERGRRDAFRSDLAPRDIHLLDEQLGPVLERYGYGTPMEAGHEARGTEIVAKEGSGE